MEPCHFPFCETWFCWYYPFEFFGELKILTQRDVNLFLKSIKTVATEMVIDLNKIKIVSKKKFLSKYGHLRPGTYDIMSKSYDEMSYFKKDKARITKKKIFLNFQLSKKRKLIGF